MRTPLATTAAQPIRSGRRLLDYAAGPQPGAAAFRDDLRLFATTYAAGFLFVAILIF